MFNGLKAGAEVEGLPGREIPIESAIYTGVVTSPMFSKNIRVVATSLLIAQVNP